MSTKRFKAGVVGCGRSGSLFDSDKKRSTISSHCGAYQNHPKTILRSICDQDEIKLLTSSELWDVEKTYTDYKDMLDKEDLDIVSICTLPDSHLEIAQYAVESGVKAIFCEKPISHSLKSASSIIALCQKKDVHLIINHQRRWSATFRDLRDRLTSKEFGEIQHINFFYSRGVYNSGSHLFDLLRMLFGEIVEVSSLNSITDFEDEKTITAYLEFLQGYPGIIIGVNGNHFRLFNLEIFTTKGRLSLDSSLDCQFSYASESLRSEEFKELTPSIRIDLENDTQSLFLNALDEITSLLKGSKINSCTGVDGYKSLEIIKSLEDSFKEKEKKTLTK